MIKNKLIKYKVEVIIFSVFFFYLLLLRFLIPIFDGGPIPLGLGILDWDFYIRMSIDISSIFKSEIIKPFCHRPLIPLLAALIPFNLEASYVLINFFSIYFTGILLYLTLRLKFNKLLSMFGLIIFCYLNYIPTARINLFNYTFFHAGIYEIYNVDIPAFFFLMCSFYCILSSKKKTYAIVLILGVLTKELILITIPVFLIYEFSKRDRNIDKKQMYYSFLRNILFIIPGILTWFILQIIVIPDPISNYPYWYDQYQGDYASISMIQMFLELRIEQIFENLLLIDWVIIILAMPFIVFIVIWFFNRKSIYKSLAKFYGISILVVYSQILQQGALIHWTFGTWGIFLMVLCLLNNRSEFIYWMKFYGVFMLLVYSQLLLGFAETKYIHYGFFPMIFLGVSGLNRISISMNKKIEERRWVV